MALRLTSVRWTTAALALLVPAAPPASAQSSPLSRSFEASTAPLSGRSTQPNALWYYGQSYSHYYDRPPAGITDTGPSYRPSLRSDPYYGKDYIDRVERGQRFGPLAPWPHRLHER